LTDDVVETLKALGVSEETIERALERGDPQAAIFDEILMPAIAERTVSAVEIAERGGIPVTTNLSVMQAFGLPTPRPQEPYFTPQEADALVEIGRLGDLWPEEVMIQVSRVYGRLLARIAQTEIQLFRLHVERRLLAEGKDPLAALRRVQDAFARLLPVSEPILVGVHRRWVEHELAQAAVREAETETGSGSLPGAVKVTFLFCDLKDFTAYADREGDQAAVNVIDRFAHTVVRQRGPGFHFTKALGDGFMLVYDDAHSAVSAGGRVVDAMRGIDTPGVHASVHSGVALVREGDYFGSAVNLAARLLLAAERDELVATQPVVDATGKTFLWDPAGTRQVKGMADPVELYRLRGSKLSAD
jgi:adenylate cyclase